MRPTHIASLFLGAGLVGILASGCGGGDDPASQAQQMLAPIDAAIQSPTGTLSAKSAPLAFSSQSLSGSTAISTAFSGFGVSGSADSCYNGDLSGGTIDYGCLGGSGSADVAIAKVSDTEYYFVVALHEACAADVCIDGKIASHIAASAAGFETEVAIEADVTAGTVKDSIHFGMKMTDGQGGLTTELVYFDSEGNSFKAEVDISSGSADLTVTGKNGTFTCSGTDATGTCTGSADISW